MKWTNARICVYSAGRFSEFSSATVGVDSTSSLEATGGQIQELTEETALGKSDCVLVLFESRKTFAEITALANKMQYLPIILLGTQAEKQNMRMALDIGAYHYLIRENHTFDQLKTAIQTVLDHHDQARRIRESEQRFQALLHATPAIFWATDSDGIITYHEGAVQRAGYTAGELVGTALMDHFSEHPHIQEDLRRALGGESVEFTGKRNGHTFKTYVVPLQDASRNTTGIAAVSVDETDQKRAEGGFHIFKAATNASTEAVIVTGANLDVPGPRIEYANPAFLKMTGYTEEELLGTSPRLLQGPLSDRATLKRLKTELKRGQSFFGETTNYRKDGSSFLVEFHIDPVRDANGQVTHFVGIHRDVTEARRKERALRASEEQFRSFIDANPASAWIVDRDGRYLYANQTMAGSWNLPREEIIGKTVYDLFDHKVAQGFVDANLDLIEKRESVVEENSLPKPDGTYWTLLIYRFAMSTSNGEWVVGGTGINITDRKYMEETLKQSEKALRESLELYTVTVRAAAAGLWDWDINSGKVVYGEWFKKMLGYDIPTEDTIEEFTSILHPDDTRHTWEAIREHLEGRAPYFQVEYRLRNHQDEYMWFSARGEAMRDEHGQPTRMVGACYDITSRKTAEVGLQKRTLQQAAVAALGQTGVSGKPTPELLQDAAEYAAQVLEAPLSAIYRLDRETNTLHMIAGTGWKDGVVGNTSISAGPESLCGYTLHSAHSVVVDDATREQDCPRHELLAEYDVHSSLVAIIEGVDGPFGVLGVYCSKERSFSGDDVAFAESVAHILASSIQRADSESRIKRHLNQLDALRNIDLAITGSLDLRVTLNVVTNQIVDRLGVDAASVLMLRSAGTLEFASGCGFRTGLIRNSRLAISNSVAGRAIIQRRTQTIDDLHKADKPFPRRDLIRAEFFEFYVVTPIISKGEVHGVLELFSRSPMQPDAMWYEFVESLAGQTAIAIDNAGLYERLQMSNLELTLAYDTTLEGWSHALDLRDKETEGHTLRVTELTEELARRMNLPEAQILQIRRGSLLHDIGKMGIPDSILLKPGPLTEEEWKIMKMHPVYAYDLLSPIEFLRPALDIPYCHHEKWDGTGYPRGLAGEEIPLAARIFAIVDIWDALLSDRPYRKAWPAGKVRDHIVSLSGNHLDPEVVTVFLETVPLQISPNQ